MSWPPATSARLRRRAGAQPPKCLRPLPRSADGSTVSTGISPAWPAGYDMKLATEKSSAFTRWATPHLS